MRYEIVIDLDNATLQQAEEFLDDVDGFVFNGNYPFCPLIMMIGREESEDDGSET